MDLVDLPLPRKPNHVWVLSHEESPKNNIIFSFKGLYTDIVFATMVSLEAVTSAYPILMLPGLN